MEAREGTCESLSNSGINSIDPCLGCRMINLILGRGVKFRYLFLCSWPWALWLCATNLPTVLIGSVVVEMGPQVSGFYLKYILVKEIHAGFGLNTESLSACYVGLLSGNHSPNSHHYSMLIL